MVTHLTINAGDWYGEEALRAMGFSTVSLDRARAKGELRCKSVSKRQRLYKGEWVLAWLESTGPKPRPTSSPKD